MRKDVENQKKQGKLRQDKPPVACRKGRDIDEKWKGTSHGLYAKVSRGQSNFFSLQNNMLIKSQANKQKEGWKGK